MRNIIVRNVPEDVLSKIDLLASKRHVSREEYIRVLLKDRAVDEEILYVQERYETLVKSVLDVLEIQTYRLNNLLERME